MPASTAVLNELPGVTSRPVLEIATDRAAISRWRDEWELLERAATVPVPITATQATPMQTFAWSWASVLKLSALGRPAFVGVRREQRLCAIAPLVNRPGVWPRCQELIGVDLITEPMDFVYHDEAALDMLVESLASRGRPLYLPRVPADAPSLPSLRRAFAGRAVIVERPQPNYPFIDLDAGWLDPGSQLNSKRRSDLRRAHKRASEIGPVTCEVICPQPNQLDALLDRAWAIESRSWKGAAGTAVVDDPLRQPFYRRLAREACAAGTLRLAWLRYGTTTVAMQYALVSHERFWLFKIGYDEQFARTSPGNLLIAETLAWSARHQLKSYEFLGTAADWTRVWTETERRSVSVRIYPYTPLGIAALAGDAARFGSEKLQARWLCKRS